MAGRRSRQAVIADEEGVHRLGHGRFPVAFFYGVHGAIAHAWSHFGPKMGDFLRVAFGVIAAAICMLLQNKVIAKRALGLRGGAG